MPLLVSLFASRPDPELTVDRVFGQIQSDWGGLLAEEFTTIRPETALETMSRPTRGDAMGFRFDDTRVVVAAFDLLYQFDAVSAAEASAHWDDALELPDLAGTSFVATVVPNLDAGDDEDDFYLREDRDIISEAILISRVVASVQACTDTVTAVYAHPSDMLVPPQVYRQSALDAAPGLPLTMWVDFLVADESGVTSGETFGMSDLGLYDIEIPESRTPGEAVVRVLADTAVLQYREGPVIDDGMVIESDYGDFSAGIEPSKYDPEQWVLILSPPVLANRAQRRAAQRKNRRR
ncbi:DUF4261 domain-containing protein [Gordonia hydrophobica]|uniref:DUF4261 domain-containing protein n=1 Tax=Gordonia hydrophobica TaxID=40516 RepID=A0ABZ2U826_9ACTN|nr:DUF4261 domain-containing protein [Gordonia hydrophobica]